MKSILKRLILLYPKSWRNRYENEFNALLDEVPPSLRTLFDVFGGAVKMQVKIWSPWKIVAAFAMLGVLAALAFLAITPSRYVSIAVLKMGDGELPAAIQQVESRSFLMQLINEEDLYKGERRRQPVEDIIQNMRARDINVRMVGAAPVHAFSISFESADAAQAQRTTQKLASRFVEAHAGEFLDQASLPIHPTGPRGSRVMFFGLASGLLAGLLFALFSVLKMWKLAAMLGTAGAVLLCAASYLEPEQYSSNAVLAYRTGDQAKIRQFIDTVMSNASLHVIAMKFGLYPNEPRPEQELRDHLHVQDLQNSRAIMVQFDYPDQLKAQRVTQSVVALLVKENWNFEILDPPNLPQRPYFPNRSMAAGSGLAMGLAIATILGIRERRRHL